MGKGEYGYLETASVCQIFQHLLNTLWAFSRELTFSAFMVNPSQNAEAEY